MRSLNRGGLLVVLLALTAVLLSGTLTMAGDGPWTFEARGVVINPVKDDGTVTYADVANQDSANVDFLRAIVPELAFGVRVSDRASLELSAAMFNMDLELDAPGAGELDFGDTDVMLLQLSALFDLGEWGNTTVRGGVVLAYADFDDIDITPAAEQAALDSGFALRRAPLDSTTLYGVVLRFDTPIGRGDWYFSSNLRYLLGGPDLEIEARQGASPLVLGTASTDFDPLIVSFGFGYRY